MRDMAAYYRDYRRKKEGKPDYTAFDMEKCLICNKLFVFLGSHVRQTHKMYMADYKEEFGLDTKKGRTHGQFRKLKAKRVVETGTINNLKKGAEYRFVKGDKKAGRYQRSSETKDRLRRQGQFIGDKFGGVHY